MNPDVIFPIVMVATVAAVVIVISIIQAKKAKANLIALGDKLGLSLETQGRYFKKHRLTGLLSGKAVEVFSYTTGAGKSKRTWAAVSVRVKASGGLTFSLKRRLSLFEFVAKLFRKNSVELGDAAFDKKWVLTTNQPDFMRVALLPEMREKIMRLSGGSMASGHYKCERDTVQYAEQGSFSSAKVCTRFAAIAGLVCDLADVVEIRAEVQK
jgi:hypothetical protein